MARCAVAPRETWERRCSILLESRSSLRCYPFVTVVDPAKAATLASQGRQDAALESQSHYEALSSSIIDV